MPDQELEIAQLIATFREGRDALTEGLDLLDEQDFDMATIHRLLEANRDLADQAQALVPLMRNCGADEAAVQYANDLAAFFLATEESIEAKLGLGRE
jgi:uncharacterized membrane protein